MKISKKEMLNYLKDMIVMGLLFDLIALTQTFKDKNFPNLKLLFALFIITGPSVGYGVYKVHKNEDKKQEDISYTQDMIFKTAFEIFFILFPLWLLMKAIRFI